MVIEYLLTNVFIKFWMRLVEHLCWVILITILFLRFIFSFEFMIFDFVILLFILHFN
jgi:hypothetical protein